jgi:tetratricopeptide (TPR) repeat protein/transcriptional regulator with XRE-family HTH domain
MDDRDDRVNRSGMFAGLLRRQRESAGLTQAELAVRAGLGERTISNLERGINRSPYPTTVRLLCDALGLSDEARAVLAAAARPKAGGEATAQTPIGGYLGAAPGSPLVARGAERASIVNAVSAVLHEAGRVVLLTGAPGIGKTRLAQEAALLAAEQGFLVAAGRCYEPTSGTPFAPFLEAAAMLHQAAPPQIRSRLAERWPSMMPLLPEEFPSAPQLDTAAVPTPDEVQRLYRAMSGFVRELATLRPVAILLDDLHWADGASLELLAHLARHIGARQRVLLLGTYRNVGLARTHPLREVAQSLHHEGLTETITVDCLDRDAITSLITDRLEGGPVSQEFVTLIHRHAQGNPFFTVEILKALIERGDLSRVDGQWLRRELSDLEAPVSVSDAIEERVARLSPTTQDLLHAVTVLGEVVHVDDLAIIDIDEARLEAALDEAVASGLLCALDNLYAFDHVLTHQALYSALSPIRRRKLHRLAGEQLEARADVIRRRRATEMARHFEAGGAPGRALPYVLIAGDAAAEIYAPGEALQHYRHAAELAEQVADGAVLADAHERVGRVLLATGRYQEAIQHLDRAAETYRRTGGDGSLPRVEGMIAHAHYRRGAGDVAAARLAHVIAELDVPPGNQSQDVDIAVLCTGLARVRLALREHPLALDAADRAAHLAKLHGITAIEADAEAIRGTVFLFLDRPNDAIAALERAISLAADLNTATGARDALLALQWTYTMRGDLARAQAVGEHGLKVTRLAGDNDAHALHAANLGLTLFYRGDWAAANTNLEHSLELARSRAPTLFSGIPPAYLGLLRRGQGDLEAAESCYREAASAPDLRTFAFDAYIDARLAELDLLRGSPPAALHRLEPWLEIDTRTRPHDVMLLCTAAEACLELGDLARGDELAKRALARAAATRNETDGLDASRLRARSLALQGRQGEARSRLEETLARASGLPHPAAEARLHRELAQLSLAEGDREHAQQQLAAAVDIFTRLGAAHDHAATAKIALTLERATT